MHPNQLIRRLCAAAVLSLACSACASQQPSRWTVWYSPGEPKPGVKLALHCNTYVFATAPVPVTYDVAVVQGWTGARRPSAKAAAMHSGETFSGPLDLGSHTIHDESNGYDLNVDVVYTIGTYLSAKARADADCPLRSV